MEIEEIKARLSKGTFVTIAKVFNLVEADLYASMFKRISVIYIQVNGASEAVFFANDFHMGTHVLSDAWKHSAFPVRPYVKGQSKVVVESIQEILIKYHANAKILETLDDLAKFVLETKTFTDEVVEERKPLHFTVETE
jgi:hypothetical protein